MATFSPRRTCGIAASCTGVGPCTSISGSRACRAGARALRAANPVSYRPKTYARNSQRRVVAPPATLPTPGRGLHLQPRSCNAAETRQHGLLLLAPKHYLSRVAAGRFAQRTLLQRVDLPQAVASTALPQLAPVPVHRGLGQRPGVPRDAAAAQQGRHRTCTGWASANKPCPMGTPWGKASTVTRSSTPRLMNGPEARRAGRPRGAPPPSRPAPGSAAASLRGTLPCAASSARSSAAKTAVAAAPGASRRRVSACGAPSASSPAALVRRGCARRVQTNPRRAAALGSCLSRRRIRRRPLQDYDVRRDVCPAWRRGRLPGRAAARAAGAGGDRAAAAPVRKQVAGPAAERELARRSCRKAVLVQEAGEAERPRAQRGAARETRLHWAKDSGAQDQPGQHTLFCAGLVSSALTASSTTLPAEESFAGSRNLLTLLPCLPREVAVGCPSAPVRPKIAKQRLPACYSGARLSFEGECVGAYGANRHLLSRVKEEPCRHAR